MGTTLRLPAILPLTLTALPIFATTPASMPATTQAAVDARVNELVAHLNADAFKERQAAQEQLSALGDDALPAVRAARESATDPETRGRLDAVIRVIERNSINAPTRVSLVMHGANPREAFDALAKQSGYAMRIWPDYLFTNQGPQKTVTLDLNDVTYWTAMRALCSQAEVRLQTMGGTERYPTVMQGASEWTTAPEVQSGPFLVVVTDVTRNHVANLAKSNDVHRDLHVSVVILPEMKLNVIQADHELAVQTIEDETGASVLPNGQREIKVGPGWGQPSPWYQYPYQYSVQLDSWRSPIGKRIATFKGSARFRVQSRGGQIVFPDALHALNVSQTVDGRHVILQSCTRQNDAYQIQLKLIRDGLTMEQWQQLERCAHNMQVVDGDGTVYTMRGGGGGGGDKESNWSFTLMKDHVAANGERHANDPPKVVVEFPLEVRDVTVPFEFHDLPIP